MVARNGAVTKWRWALLLCPLLLLLAGVAWAAIDPKGYILMDDIDNWRAEMFAGNPASRSSIQGPKFEGTASGIIVFDSQGTGYIASETFIEVVNKDGQARILTGAPDIAGNTDGPPGAATFANAIDIVIANDNLLYVVDAASLTLRKLERRDGVWITETVAGVPGVKGHRDGPGKQALFTTPFESLAVDEKGVVYVCDGDWLRKVENGVVTTLNGGSGYRNGPLGQSLMSRSQGRQHGLAYDGKGNLYIADKGNMAIRKVDLAKKEVTTVAGVMPDKAEGRALSHDSLNALDGRFNPAGGPNMIFYDKKYDRFIIRADDEDVVRMLEKGALKSFGPATGKHDSLTGPWKSAVAGYPCGVDSQGNVYIMDGNCIRVVKKVKGDGQ